MGGGVAQRMKCPRSWSLGLWLFASIALHSLLVLAPSLRISNNVQLPNNAMTWVEFTVPEPESLAPLRAAEPQREAGPSKAQITRSNLAIQRRSRNSAGATVQTRSDAVPEFAKGDSAVASSGQEGSAAPSERSATSVLQRHDSDASQLSMWINPPLVEHLALLRPTMRLLVSVPGFRDMLRGSGLQVFGDLQQLRLFLPGTAPAQLMLAGVHTGGEDKLVLAAQRSSAMRGRALEWRGNAALRATAWIDGSGIDRGLAVAGAAFTIGARARMASWLGAVDPELRVRQLSALRARVVVALVVDDVARYLPEPGRCGLQTMHVNVAAAAEEDELRLTLSTRYADDAALERAPNCLRELDQLPCLRSWLIAAESQSRSTRGVSRDDMERVLEEIAWALRP
jgi:hypothetical protein